jgi:hypothetical protein
MTRDALTIRSICALALTALIVHSASLRAQAEPVGRHEGGRGFFKVGALALDLDALNSSLRGAGYPELSSSFLTLGGGGFGGRGRWAFGGEGHGIIGRNRTTDDGAYRVSANGGYGLFRVAYATITRRHVDVYPSIGIGGGGMQLDIRGRSSPSFAEVLADPGRSARLSTGGLIVDVGVSADYRIHVPQPGGEPAGPLVGVSAGWLGSPAVGEWDLDGLNSVAGGPTLRIEGFYARISLGGWGRSRARGR